MSEIRVNSIVSETGTGNVAFNKGINVTGVVTGTSFAGNLTGDVTGNVTGNCSGTSGSATGNAGGLTGTPDITVRNITGVAATFTGAVTYEDVTNIDSIGIVTARGGLEVGAAGVGGTISATGNVEFAGITTVGTALTLADNKHAQFGSDGDMKIYHNGSYGLIDNITGEIRIRSQYVALQPEGGGAQMVYCTQGGSVDIYHNGTKKLETSATGVTVAGNATATQFIGVSTGGTASGATVGVGTTATILGVTDGATQNRFAGVLVEKVSIQAAKLADTTVDLAQGNVHYFTTNGTGATTAAIKYKGGNNVSTFMNIGDNISVSIISLPNNAEYINAVTIDGGAVTEEWLGGSVPSAASGAAGSVTITTINITKILNSGTDANDFLVLCAVNNYAN